MGIDNLKEIISLHKNNTKRLMSAIWINQYINSSGRPHAWILFLHLFRFSTISTYKSNSFISFSTPSLQIIFDLPHPFFEFLRIQTFYLRFHGSLIFSPCTCPLHLKQSSFLFSSIFTTPNPFLISYLIISFKVCSLIH